MAVLILVWGRKRPSPGLQARDDDGPRSLQLPTVDRPHFSPAGRPSMSCVRATASRDGTTSAAFAAAGGYHHHIGLNTWESQGGSPPPTGATGLYHLAILYPDRRALADALRRLIAPGIPLDGAADHGVSEALYLRDPDGNGVELYRDRPQDRPGWPGRRAVQLRARRTNWSSRRSSCWPMATSRHSTSGSGSTGPCCRRLRAAGDRTVLLPRPAAVTAGRGIGVCGQALAMIPTTRTNLEASVSGPQSQPDVAGETTGLASSPTPAEDPPANPGRPRHRPGICGAGPWLATRSHQRGGTGRAA